MTTIAEPTNTSERATLRDRKKMTAIMQIKKVLELFRPRKATLRLGLTPADAAFELTKISENVEEFEDMSCQLAVDNKMAKDDATILAAIEKGKFDILSHAINQDLVEKHKLQLRSYKNFDSLKKYLTSIYQSALSADEIIQNARRELSQITRFSADNETYTNFLERVETLAEPLKTTESMQLFNLFTKEAFTRNLTPQNKQFLDDHGQSTKSLAEKAKFLDERKKHFPDTSVNNIQTDAQFSKIEAQIAALTSLVQKSLRPESERQPAEANKISVQTGKIESQPAQTRNPNFNPIGRPMRCQQCGLFGHSKETCRRTLKAICHKCGRRGHLQAVCRMSKNAQ